MKLAITYATEYPRPNLIEKFVTQGLPYLTCEEANREIIRLTVEILKLQARLDANEIKP